MVRITDTRAQTLPANYTYGEFPDMQPQAQQASGRSQGDLRDRQSQPQRDSRQSQGYPRDMQSQAQQVSLSGQQQSSLSPNSRRTRTSSVSQGRSQVEQPTTRNYSQSNQSRHSSVRSERAPSGRDESIPKAPTHKRQDGSEATFKLKVASKSGDDESEVTMVCQGDGSWKPRSGSEKTRSTGSSRENYHANKTDVNGHEMDGDSEIKCPDGTFKPAWDVLDVEEFDKLRKSRVSSRGTDGARELMLTDGTWQTRSSGPCHDAKISSPKVREMDGETEVMLPDGTWQARSKVHHDDAKKSGATGYDMDEHAEIMQPDGSWAKLSVQSMHRSLNSRTSDRVSEAVAAGRDMEEETEILQPDGSWRPKSQLPPSGGRDSTKSGSFAQPTSPISRRSGSLNGESQIGSQSRRTGSLALSQTGASRVSGNSATHALRNSDLGNECSGESEILQQDGSWKARSREEQMPPTRRGGSGSYRSSTHSSSRSEQRRSSRSEQTDAASETTQLMHPDGTWAKLTAKDREELRATRAQSMQVRSSGRHDDARRSGTKGHELDGDSEIEIPDYTFEPLARVQARSSGRQKGHELDGDSEMEMPDGTFKPLSQMQARSIGRQNDASLDPQGYELENDSEIQMPEGTFKPLSQLQARSSGRHSDARYYHHDGMELPRMLSLSGVNLEGDPKEVKALQAIGTWVLEEGKLVNSRAVYRHTERRRLVLAHCGDAWFVQPETHLGRSKGCMCLATSEISPDLEKGKDWWVFNGNTFVQQDTVSCCVFPEKKMSEKTPLPEP
mmetsp:Transcript_518/g.824  ORF Transcript_518/g.824 Transcript_518/m.824 type:complete len:785 (-) Transcript_518:301-2655(-)